MATEKPDAFEMEPEPDFEGPANRISDTLERIESDLSDIKSYVSNWNAMFWGVVWLGIFFLAKDAFRWLGDLLK